jgi:membrane protein implicated in regulation of membrane protease activity
MPTKTPEESGFWAGVLDLSDALVVIIAGAVLALMSLLGVIKDPAKLAAATLAVLAVVAVSVLRDRLSRRHAEVTIDKIQHEMAELRRAANALEVGRQYHVVLHDTTWDLATVDGSVVNVTRVKHLVFDQDEVIAIYDFASGDGERTSVYSPGEEVGEPLMIEGQRARLISLKRMFSRGDTLEFGLTRTTINGFLSEHESVSVLTRDITARMRLSVVWPAKRPPRAIRLSIMTAAKRSSTTDVTGELAMRDGRPIYVADLNEPEKGGTTTIEWEW